MLGGKYSLRTSDFVVDACILNNSALVHKFSYSAFLKSYRIRDYFIRNNVKVKQHTKTWLDIHNRLQPPTSSPNTSNFHHRLKLLHIIIVTTTYLRQPNNINNNPYVNNLPPPLSNTHLLFRQQSCSLSASQQRRSIGSIHSLPLLSISHSRQLHTCLPVPTTHQRQQPTSLTLARARACDERERESVFSSRAKRFGRGRGAYCRATGTAATAARGRRSPVAARLSTRTPPSATHPRTRRFARGE